MTSRERLLTVLNGKIPDCVPARRTGKPFWDLYLLSTGDQCGRDTPDQNLAALIETARTYGRY